MDKAITDMPDDYILKQFLVTHRAEVNGMLVTEYNEEETLEFLEIPKQEWIYYQGRI